MPLERLPKYHGTGKDIDLVVVFWMRVPELWRLPIHSSNETANHRSSRLLHLGQPKICNLGRAFGGDKDIGRFAVSMDDGRLSSVEVFQPPGNIEHHL